MNLNKKIKKKKDFYKILFIKFNLYDKQTKSKKESKK